MATNTPASDSGVFSREEIDAKKLRKPKKNPYATPDSQAQESSMDLLKKAKRLVRETREAITALNRQKPVGKDSESLLDEDSGVSEEITAEASAMYLPLAEFLDEQEELLRSIEGKETSFPELSRRAKAIRDSMRGVLGFFEEAAVVKDRFELIPGQSSAEEPLYADQVRPVVEKLQKLMRTIDRLLKNP